MSGFPDRSLAHEDFARDKMMIMVAPNGARRTARDHPALPITPEALAQCAEQVRDAGAAALHLHVRDEAGRHSLDPDLYRAALSAIRNRIRDSLVLQVTTEAVGQYSRAEQMALVRELKPEAVSLALKELCPTEDSLPEAGKFFAWCRAEQIWPQYILYSPEDVRRFEALRRRGIFGEDAPSALFVLGRYTTDLTGVPEQLDDFLQAVENIAFPWSCCCFGMTEHDAMMRAAHRGGHARIGFENNLHLREGPPAPDNAALVRQLVQSLSRTGRRPATADEVRDIFSQQ